MIIYILLGILFFSLLKFNLHFYREDNNRLVPIILDRLQSIYEQFCEENEINQNTKPFSHLNNDQIINDDNSIKYSLRKRSNLFYIYIYFTKFDCILLQCVNILIINI